jgi:hypothetical protein
MVCTLSLTTDEEHHAKAMPTSSTRPKVAGINKLRISYASAEIESVKSTDTFGAASPVRGAKAGLTRPA